MKKKAYIKPSVQVIELRHQGALLVGSSTPPNEIPEYDDLFG